MGLFNQLLSSADLEGIRRSLVAPSKYLSNITSLGLGDTTTLSMDDYTPEAKKLLKKMIAENGEGTYDLKRGEDSKGDFMSYDRYAPKGFGGMLDQILSPYGQLRNTLGSFNVVKDPKTGELVLKDTYDWDEAYDKRSYLDSGVGLNTLGKFGRVAQNNRKALGLGGPKAYEINTGLFTN